MAKYRRRVDILADIVNAAKKGARKTKIMYVANLSYGLLKKYLEEALSMQFVSYDGEGYGITEKGQSFLEKYTQFSNKYTPLRKAIDSMEFDWECLEEMCEPERNNNVNSLGNKRNQL